MEPGGLPLMVIPSSRPWHLADPGMDGEGETIIESAAASPFGSRNGGGANYSGRIVNAYQTSCRLTAGVGRGYLTGVESEWGPEEPEQAFSPPGSSQAPYFGSLQQPPLHVYGGMGGHRTNQRPPRGDVEGAGKHQPVKIKNRPLRGERGSKEHSFSTSSAEPSTSASSGAGHQPWRMTPTRPTWDEMSETANSSSAASEGVAEPDWAHGVSEQPHPQQQRSDAVSPAELQRLYPQIPRDAKGVLTSVGSIQHASGSCRPCGFFYGKSGCLTGIKCKNCHMLHRRKDRPRLGRRERLLDAGRLNGEIMPDEGSDGVHRTGIAGR
jgi:hypothetical protein